MAVDYNQEVTARASDNHVLPHAYDEKEDMDSLKAKLREKKKPIYIGLAFLCVVIIGCSIGFSAGGSESASNQSALDSSSSGSGSVSSAPSPSSDDTEVGTVVANNEDYTASSSGRSSASASSSGSTGSVAGEADLGSSSGFSLTSSNDTSASASTPMDYSADVTLSSSPAPADTTSAPASTAASSAASDNGEVLGYSIVDFDFTDSSLWEYASGASVPSSMFSNGQITLNEDNSAEPIRTIQGWSGEKIVYVEWTRSSTSDTNIWMLNTKLEDQFATGNGWPYWGEIDLFEMFTEDAKTYPSYDFSGFGSFSDVSSYGQLTMHMGPATENGSPCYCPASASKSSWYQSTQPMTSGCTAQFSNDASNSIAAVWGSDSNGQFIQLMQNPTITKGGKLNGVDTYDIAAGGITTTKIYNNANLFWGVDASDACATAGGHNANTGFPFFESFRIILEEQKTGDSSATFSVTNIQVFTPN